MRRCNKKNLLAIDLSRHCLFNLKSPFPFMSISSARLVWEHKSQSGMHSSVFYLQDRRFPLRGEPVSAVHPNAVWFSRLCRVRFLLGLVLKSPMAEKHIFEKSPNGKAPYEKSPNKKSPIAKKPTYEIPTKNLLWRKILHAKNPPIRKIPHKKSLLKQNPPKEKPNTKIPQRKTPLYFYIGGLSFERFSDQSSCSYRHWTVPRTCRCAYHSRHFFSCHK